MIMKGKLMKMMNKRKINENDEWKENEWKWWMEGKWMKMMNGRKINENDEWKENNERMNKR